MPSSAGLAQHIGGEVVRLVPLQRVWREALLGERGRRFGDHAFVVVEPEARSIYFIVGMTNSAPWLPEGQRSVTVLTLV